jgi:uncharacterized protein YcaQ
VSPADLSPGEARRLALSAQGFGQPPAKPTLAHVRKLLARPLPLQLDTVNVLVRSHYLSVYSRLGPYPMRAIDELAYERRELFETWTHSSCLVPVELYPLFRYRNGPIRELDWIDWPEGQEWSDNAKIAALYDEVVQRGPLAAKDLATARPRTSAWWGWDESKVLLESLLDCGILAVAGRTAGFSRLYDIAERVIPQAVLDRPAPDREEAQRELLHLSARAVGIGTAKEIARYLGLDAHNRRTLVRDAAGKWIRPNWKRRIAELVEAGRLTEVSIDGQREPAYVVPGTRIPRTFHARALLSPFDAFVRVSAESLCDFTNPLSQQLYVPAERRQYGYYVLPFLLGDTLVGRCDLKADRDRSTLMVQAAYVEPGQNAEHVAAELAVELGRLGDWLELEDLEVADRGNLRIELRRAAEGG